MVTKSIILPHPTKDLVQSYVQQYNQSQVVVEKALTKLFGLVPDNTTFEDVLLKVVALNDLYRTAIWATYQVAEHIYSLNIDPLIRDGKPEAVNLIAKVSLGNKIRNNYSFATKYCSWHNPGVYPIYDSFVEQILWGYKKQDQFEEFYRQDLWSYDRFKQIVIKFRSYYQLDTYDLRDIDKFLWLAGKEYFPPTWG